MTPCPGAPSGLWAMSTHLHKIPIIGSTQYLGVLCYVEERSRNNLSVFNFWFRCLALHRWNRSLAKTPVCFLSQWGWGERCTRVCLPLEQWQQQKKSNQKARWNGCVANNEFSEFSLKKIFLKRLKKKKVITWPICYIKWLSVYKLFLRKFLCLYKKKINRWKNFQNVFVYSVVRIYSCYCDILWILYIMKKRNFVYFEWLKLRQL